MAVSRAHPAGDTSGILTGSGFTRWQEEYRAAAVARHDAVYEIGATLQRGFEKRGKRWAMGMDVKWMARKIVRPLLHAADLELDIARAVCLSYERYCGMIGTPTAKAGAGTFDETK